MAGFLDPNDPRIQGAGALTDAGDWFSQQGAPTGRVSGIMAPRQTAEDQRLLQDPAFRAQYGAWVNAQGPGAADYATPTGFQAWQQQQGAPTGGGVLADQRQFASPETAAWYQGGAVGLPPGAQTAGGGYTGPDIAGGGWTGGATGVVPGQLPGQPTAGQPGAAPPGGQNYQQIVETLMAGSNDPEKLRQIAPQLAQYGITLSNPNASGDLSKIILPDGTPIRVIGAGEGHAVWNPQPGNWGPGGVPMGGQSGNGMGPLGAFAGGLDPSAAGRLGYSGGLGLNVDVTQDPSYQFRLQEGQKALERSAAAKGTLLTGGTAKALARYGQDLASTEYGNVYNRALGENQAAYGRLFGEQQNRNNQLMGLANLGATAASAQGNLGSTYAGQAGTLLGSQATNIGNNLTGAGNANAASTLAQGNAWNQGLQGVGQGANNAALQMHYLSRLYGGGGAGTIPTPPTGYGVLT